MSNLSEDLLPVNSTPQERALVRASCGFDSTLYNVWDPQTCPEGILPWLAHSLSVDNWDPNWDPQAKRNAIAESVKIHRSKGTIGALKRALQAIGYEVIVDENTGEAYTFRLQVKPANDQEVTEKVINEVEQIALNAKNARSHLVGVDTLLRSDGLFTILAANNDGLDTQIEAYYNGEISLGTLLNILSAEYGALDTTTYPPLQFTAQIDFNGGFIGGAYETNYVIELELELNFTETFALPRTDEIDGKINLGGAYTFNYNVDLN